MASGDAAGFDDPGVFREIPLVNRIRQRVKAWRESGHPGVTGITKRLLEHWNDPEEFESRRFFFCQLEAAETLIWLNEAPPSERVDINILSDGGTLKRLCAKMATGSSKTVVMAMVIAWPFSSLPTPRTTTRSSASCHRRCSTSCAVERS